MQREFNGLSPEEQLPANSESFMTRAVTIDKRVDKKQMITNIISRLQTQVTRNNASSAVNVAR